MKQYELGMVDTNKNYSVSFYVDGELMNMRLAIIYDNKRKVLTPWRNISEGSYYTTIQTPVAGALIVEDKSNTASIINIIVEEE